MAYEVSLDRGSRNLNKRNLKVSHKLRLVEPGIKVTTQHEDSSLNCQRRQSSQQLSPGTNAIKVRSPLSGQRVEFSE